MRVDKYIWHVRLFKTRSVATKACKEGKVLLHAKSVKPSAEVSNGDVIGIKKHGLILTYKVVDLPKNRIGAKLVEDYLIETTSEETLEKLKTIQVAQKQYRSYGTGKPSKKDRRAINKFFKK